MIPTVSRNSVLNLLFVTSVGPNGFQYGIQSVQLNKATIIVILETIELQKNVKGELFLNFLMKNKLLQ